jgi:RimJ/RimL family protein N-acetyltransferase
LPPPERFERVETERLLLRRPRAGDVERVFAIHGDPETNRHNPSGPDADTAASAARLRGWLETWERDGFGYWAVARRDDGRVVGFGGVELQRWRSRSVLNLYYRFGPAAWGHGFAAETALTAVRLGRRLMPELAIVARTRPANVSAACVAEAAGLRRHPELDGEHVVFTLSWGAVSGARRRGSSGM